MDFKGILKLNNNVKFIIIMVKKTINADEFYQSTLTEVPRSRYLEKLLLIDGVDPYKLLSLDEQSMSSDRDVIPEVLYIDIVNYLINSISQYTYETLKAYRNLESWKIFVSGWVGDVLSKKIDGKFLIIGRLLHSEKMSDVPLRPWIILSNSGVILAGRCNCMAGLGEICSHVGAVLFFLECASRIKQSTSVTDSPAYWKMPTTLRKVEYSQIKDIDFSSPAVLKNNMDLNIEANIQKNDVNKKCIKRPPPLSQLELSCLFDKIAPKKPAILSIMSTKYAKNYIPQCLNPNFPISLCDLFDSSLTVEEDILIKSTDFYDNLQVSTSNQSKAVELATKGQSDNKLWFQFRSGRITAFKMKAICATSIESPSISLLKSVCYAATIKFRNNATNWG